MRGGERKRDCKHERTRAGSRERREDGKDPAPVGALTALRTRCGTSCQQCGSGAAAGDAAAVAAATQHWRKWRQILLQRMLRVRPLLSDATAGAWDGQYIGMHCFETG